jgi:hypothetical protein
VLASLRPPIGLAAPPGRRGLLQRLLHLVLHLSPQRLQRLVDLPFDLLAGQLERLLHLLTHGLGDLALHLSEDRLDGLADLLLQRLTQILIDVVGCSPLAVVPGRAVAPLLPLALPRTSISRWRFGLPVAPASVVVALAILGP